MRYKVTIRRKNGILLVKETNDRSVVNGFIKTAEMYGDKVLRIEEKDASTGYWKPLVGLIGAGMTLGLGLGILGAVGSAFKK